VDEIQLCADGERGHVFTDRLLHARGTEETLFLGSETVRGLLKHLVPRLIVETRPRFSKLVYAGPKKLSRLPARSAVVAFSAADVYGLAEMVRRQRGGAAVVLGALSPRARNAQVAMYQAGEVDFLVATDAVGMGLNMDVDHVAFAATRKFDGLSPRALTAAEMGQIAGRAGRHMNDGTFGTTNEVGPLDADLVEQIEQHRFDPVPRAQWRNARLDFASVPLLLRSLDEPPTDRALQRAREAEDHLSLKALAQDHEIAARVTNPDHVHLLWQVCQVPDYRKALHEQHVRLLRQIFLRLRERGRLPVDWVAQQLTRLEQSGGDIDTLATRLAHVRTWTFIAHRGDWLADSAHWQERARAIEDKLSDALHERLTQRFVDRRAAALVKGLADGRELSAAVQDDGGVTVEGQFVGRIEGLTFIPDAAAMAEQRALRTAANRTLGAALASRAEMILGADDAAFTLGDDATLRWRDEKLARLAPGGNVLRPRLKLLGGDGLEGTLRDRVKKRAETWLEGEIARVLAPLVRLRDADLPGPLRGLAFRLVETLGALWRDDIADELRVLGQDQRHLLRRLGVKFGEVTLLVPALVRPEAVRLKALLWSVAQGRPMAVLPPPGLTSLVAPVGADADFWFVCGFALAGPRAVRLDMLERVALALRDAGARGPFVPGAEIMSLLGCGAADLPPVLRALGYAQQTAPGGVVQWQRRRNRRPPPRRVEPVAPDASSPFARLKELVNP
jgi:ATP-dependent RNA helicase SUPV3L1/SUV3